MKAIPTTRLLFLSAHLVMLALCIAAVVWMAVRWQAVVGF